jgi:flagellar motor switch/type III secretory pathway protein FliN
MAVLMGESIFTEACMAIMEGKCPEHQEAGCRDDITGKMIRPFLDELSDRLSRAWDIPVTCQTPRVIRVTTLKDLETVKNWTRFDYHWVLGDIFGARMIVLLSPEGERFSRKMARKMASNGKAEKKMYPENEPVPMCGKGGDEKDARLLGKVPLIMKWGGVPVIAEDLVNLHPGSELPLEPFLGTPVSLFVNKRRFAEGKVLVEKDTCRVLITALLGAADRGDTGKNE